MIRISFTNKKLIVVLICTLIIFLFAFILSIGRFTKEPVVLTAGVRQYGSTQSNIRQASSPDQQNLNLLISRAARQGEGKIQSFGSRKDLWGFAREGLTSDDPAYVFEALRAARSCDSFRGLWPELSVFAAGGKSAVFGPLLPERQVAIDSLQRRCEGFLSAGSAQTKELIKELSLRQGTLQTSNLEEDAISHRESELALLYSNSPASIEVGLSKIANYWKEYLDPQIKVENRLSMDVAAMLAACELGTDCSSSGYSALTSCALAGTCNKASFEDWRQEFDEKQQADIVRYRTQLVDAVNQRKVELLF